MILRFAQQKLDRPTTDEKFLAENLDGFNRNGEACVVVDVLKNLIDMRLMQQVFEIVERRDDRSHRDIVVYLQQVHQLVDVIGMHLRRESFLAEPSHSDDCRSVHIPIWIPQSTSNRLRVRSHGRGLEADKRLDGFTPCNAGRVLQSIHHIRDVRLRAAPREPSQGSQSGNTRVQVHVVQHRRDDGEEPARHRQGDEL